MPEWTPAFVLPNIELAEPVEGGSAALVPAHDPRVTSLSRAHANFRLFLRRFTDAFGVKLRPAVLLIRPGAPQSFYEVGALASFRDLIAIAVSAYNRALSIKYPRGDRVLFGNAFTFYPWMIDNNHEYLIGKTPAILGIHVVEKFRGQSSPELFRMRLGPGSIDEPLLFELLERWRRHYEHPEPSWPDLALFRSLNMAYHASLLPAASDTTFHDVGRLISLWVSAFETLAHPGGNGRSNKETVFDLIDQAAWELPACADRSYVVGKSKVRRTVGSWIYQALCDRRNAFLHGNPVTRDDLRLAASEHSLFEYAGPLYRLALTARLPLAFRHDSPSLADPESFGSYISSRSSFRRTQRTYEEALLTAVRGLSKYHDGA